LGEAAATDLSSGRGVFLSHRGGESASMLTFEPALVRALQAIPRRRFPCCPLRFRLRQEKIFGRQAR
jgi:hypothetical protein